jgi:hypothetical protein
VKYHLGEMASIDARHMNRPVKVEPDVGSIERLLRQSNGQPVEAVVAGS